MLIAVCCDRGSPGSTTTALALGVALAQPAVVVEGDPYGGDLALRCRVPGGGVLPETPTVLTVATAARTSRSPELVKDYAHPFTATTRVIPGHVAAEQAAGLTDWAPLADALHRSVTHVVVDLGRIHTRSPSLPVAAAADVVVMVTRPDLASVVHLRDRASRLVPALAELRGRPPVLFPLVVASRRAGPGHAAQVRHLVADTAAGPVIADVGWLAWDPDGVQRVERGEVPHAPRARSALLRSAATVVTQLRAAAATGATGRTSLREGAR